MSESIRPRDAARTMASQAYPEQFRGPFGSFDWELRPILVLQVSQDPGLDRVGSPVSVIGRMSRALGSRGLSASDANLVNLEGSRPDFVWPRNLPWKPLPIIEDPELRIMFQSVMPLVADGYASPDSGGMPVPGLEHDHAVGRLQRLLVEGVETVVIVSSKLDRRLLRAATAPFDARPAPSVLHFDGEALWDVPVAEIDASREAFAAHERFVYNHAVNMIVLTSRALFKVARDGGWGRSEIERRMPALDHFHSLFGDPLVLQALHEIARSGVRADPGQRPDRVPHDELQWHMAKGLPFVIEQPGDEFTFRWVGTGKHAPWVLPLGRIEPPGTVFKGMWEGRAHPPMFIMLGSLRRAGLIDLFGGRVGLTAEGVAFLDLIGPETRDVDLPLRWRTADDAWGAARDVPAMDRWLNRAFRSVKRRVAGLAASPFVEPDGDWRVPGPNRLLVRGNLVGLDEEALARPGVMEFVAGLERARRGTPFAELRTGLVYDEESTDPEAMPLAVWFGLPLGTFSQADAFQGRATLFRDMSEADAEARALSGWVLGQLGCEMPSGTELRIATVEVGSSHEPEGRWLDLQTLPVAEPGDEMADIVHGSALVIRDPRSENAQTRELLAFLFAVRDVMAEQTLDGIHVHGSRGGPAIVTYGRVMGRMNVTRGTTFAGREISQAQARGFQTAQSSDRQAYAAFFEHPRKTQDGYWAPTVAGRLLTLRSS